MRLITTFLLLVLLSAAAIAQKRQAPSGCPQRTKYNLVNNDAVSSDFWANLCTAAGALSADEYVTHEFKEGSDKKGNAVVIDRYRERGDHWSIVISIASYKDRSPIDIGGTLLNVLLGEDETWGRLLYEVASHTQIQANDFEIFRSKDGGKLFVKRIIRTDGAALIAARSDCRGTCDDDEVALSHLHDLDYSTVIEPTCKCWYGYPGKPQCPN